MLARREFSLRLSIHFQRIRGRVVVIMQEMLHAQGLVEHRAPIA